MSDGSAFPHAVIAGAPKCGTSSLYVWLADHPGTSASVHKETYFLMDKDSVLFPQARFSYHEHGLGAYSRCFAEETQGQVLFEATPDYLYQRTAPQVLGGMRPSPEIFFVLRRPSHRVLSAFRFYQGTLGAVDAALDFAAYVRLLLEPPEDPAVIGHPLAAMALEHTRYAVHLRRWLEYVPATKLHVLLFEQLRDAPGDFMRTMCRTMGLAPEFYDEYPFPVRNRSFGTRSSALVRIKNRIEPLLPSGGLRSVLRRCYRTVNIVDPQAVPQPGVKRTLAELDAYFAPDVADLAALLNLDLSAWEA